MEDGLQKLGSLVAQGDPLGFDLLIDVDAIKPGFQFHSGELHFICKQIAAFAIAAL